MEYCKIAVFLVFSVLWWPRAAVNFFYFFEENKIHLNLNLNLNLNLKSKQKQNEKFSKLN